MAIPKIIHYCWFGGKPLPELAQNCISSWKKYCAGYKIIEWNETNVDISCCDYVREAYKAKKWAFVSDYVRFKILYEQGGIYLDTDVELIQPIDDIVENGAFLCFEEGPGLMVAPGLGMAAEPGMMLYKEILENYHATHFCYDENGKYLTVVERITSILQKYAALSERKVCHVVGVNIYPPEYFCPLNFYTGRMCITENTRSIHYYTASWFSKEQKKIISIRKRFASHPYLAWCMTVPLCCVNMLRRYGFYGSVKYIYKKIRGMMVANKGQD